MADQQLESNKKQQLPSGGSDPKINNVPPAPGRNPFQLDEKAGGGIPPIPDPAPQAPSSLREDVTPARAPKNKFAAGKFSAVKIVAAALCLLVIGLAIGGGVFAYDYFFPSPKRVMEKMAMSMAQVKTMEYEGKAGIEFSYAGGAAGAIGGNSEENNKLALAFDFSGASDVRDAQRLKSSCSIKIAANPYLGKGADIGTVSIGKVSYFRINANLPEYALLFGDIFNNQWIKIDYDNIIAQMEAAYPQLADTFANNAANNTPLTPEQIDKVRVLAEKSKIMVVENKLSDETIDGVMCRHYTAKIDKEALRKFINDAGEILKDKISSQDVGVIVGALGAMDFSGIEVWVAKNDFTLRRIKGAVDAKDDFHGLAKTMYGIDIDMTYKKINQPVLIIVPEKSKPFEDVFKNSLIGTPPVAPTAVKIKK